MSVRNVFAIHLTTLSRAQLGPFAARAVSSEAFSMACQVILGVGDARKEQSLREAGPCPESTH